MYTRTLPAALIAGLLLACTAGVACAQHIYKWKDAGGVIHFSQSPPASGIRFTEVSVHGAPAVSSNPAPATHATASESESSSEAPRNRATSTGETEADTPDNRAKLCKQLDTNIALLTSKQPVVTGSAGTQRVMSDNAREQQLATARAQQAQYCSSPGA